MTYKFNECTKGRSILWEQRKTRIGEALRSSFIQLFQVINGSVACNNRFFNFLWPAFFPYQLSAFCCRSSQLWTKRKLEKGKSFASLGGKKFIKFINKITKKLRKKLQNFPKKSQKNKKLSKISEIVDKIRPIGDPRQNDSSNHLEKCCHCSAVMRNDLFLRKIIQSKKNCCQQLLFIANIKKFEAFPLFCKL